jgi:hypothetical protein
VDLSADLDAACTPEVLFAQVADLDGYPDWFGIVLKAVADPLHMDVAVTAVNGDSAWLVDLRGRLGPMARSKRLRMVRTVCDEPVRVRFERAEVDGRNHSAWVLDATVIATEAGARLTVNLHYGGSFGGALLRRMLLDEIEQARPRLAELVGG